MLTQEQIEEMLEQAGSEVRASLVEDFKSKIRAAAGMEIDSAVCKIIDQFMRDEIAPELAEALMGNKPAIIKAAIKAADEIAAEITQALVEKAKANMGSSWERKKIIGALFE